MLSKKQFAECLALHGADVESWPMPLRLEGLKAAQHGGLAPVLREYRALETALQGRAVEPMRADLADRIIAKALPRRVRSMNFGEMMSELFNSLIPHPGYAMAATLLLGAVIGFATPDNTETPKNTAMQIYLDDNGALL